MTPGGLLLMRTNSVRCWRNAETAARTTSGGEFGAQLASCPFSCKAAFGTGQIRDVDLALWHHVYPGASDE
jgi:hypothetical protein